MDVCLLWVFVLSGRGVCDGPIPRPEKSYRLWCVSECDQVKIKILYTCCEQVGRRGKDKEAKRIVSLDRDQFLSASPDKASKVEWDKMTVASIVGYRVTLVPFHSVS
jgi:hypothetical protein